MKPRPIDHLAEHDLKLDLKTAQSIWEQRIGDVERAERGEAIAKAELIAVTRRHIRYLLGFK